MKVNGIDVLKLKIHNMNINQLKASISLIQVQIKNLQNKKEGKRI